MQSLIALLRGINVGGHRVRMIDLKKYFEELGLGGVETFIASGNVVFEAAAEDSGEVGKQIEEHLHQRLGYHVPTFIRTRADIAEVARYSPFPDREMGEGKGTLSVMFMSAAAPPEIQKRLPSFNTEIDRLHAHQREIYWLCDARTTDSLLDWPKLAKELQLPLTTVRNVTTVRRMAGKYPPK